jgi:hypothetical protein
MPLAPGEAPWLICLMSASIYAELLRIHVIVHGTPSPDKDTLRGEAIHDAEALARLVMVRKRAR